MVNATIGDQLEEQIKDDSKIIFENTSGFTKRNIPHQITHLSYHTGVDSGLALSINADNTKIDVAAGLGVKVDKTNPAATIVSEINIPETLGITDPHLSETLSHMYSDAAGVLTVELNPPTRSDLLNRLYLGAVLHIGGVIVSVLSNPIVAHGTSITEMETLLLSGGTRLSGGTLSPASNDLSLSMSEITVKQYGRNFLDNPTTPNIRTEAAQTPILPAKFFKVFTDVSGDLVIDPTTNTDQLAPTLFNKDGLGILEPVSNNQFTAIRTFYSATSRNLLFYYATKQFSSMTEALTAPEPTFLESIATIDTSPISKIGIRNNVTDLSAGVIAGTALIKQISDRTQL